MASSARRITVEFLGDSKGLTKTADQVERKTSSLGSKMAHVGKIAAVGLAGGLAAAGVAMVGMVKNGAEDLAAQRRLALALKNTTGATKQQVSAVEDWITKQGVALGVTDDELRPAFQKFAQVTGSVAKAQKLTTLAMNVAAGSGKSLEVVTKSLSQAANGHVGALGKLGIQTQDSEKDAAALTHANIALKTAQLNYTKAVKDHGRTSAEAKIAADKVAEAQQKVGEATGKVKKSTIDFDEATKRLTKTFGGQAKAAANTFDGKMQRLKLVFDETKETIGQKLIPILTKFASWFLTTGIPMLSKFGEGFSKVTGFIKDHRTALIALTVTLVTLTTVTKVHAAMMAVEAAGGMLKYLQATKLVTAATKVYAAVQWVLNAALTANPIGIVVVALAALAGGIIYAYKHSEKFRAVVNSVFSWLGGAVKNTVDFVKAHWKLIASILTGPIGAATIFIVSHFGSIKTAASNVVGWIRDIPGKLKALGANFAEAGRHLIGKFVDGMKNAAGIIGGIAGNVWSTVKKLLNKAIDKINAALEFKISLPGPDISINPPNIPHLAKGGIVRARPGGTLALLGEAGRDEAVIPLGGSGSRTSAGSHDFTVTAPLVLQLDSGVVWKGLLKVKRDRGGVSLGLA